MNNDELRELITLIDTSDINVLALSRPGFKLRLEIAAPADSRSLRQAGHVLDAGAAGNTDTSAAAGVVTLVTAPHFGIFSTRHPARQEAFAEEGKEVACGDTLGMLRINEIYVPVLSPAAGSVHRLVEDGVLIGYATPLFEIVAA